MAVLSFHSGFKELVPNFAIRDAGEDQYRLPTASTCVNLLKVRPHSFRAHIISLRMCRGPFHARFSVPLRASGAENVPHASKLCLLCAHLVKRVLRLFQPSLALMMMMSTDDVFQLPRYKNEGILREKLLHAINANAGFDLS